MAQPAATLDNHDEDGDDDNIYNDDMPNQLELNYKDDNIDVDNKENYNVDEDIVNINVLTATFMLCKEHRRGNNNYLGGN